MNYVAYAALSLTNDYFSWEKEQKAHIMSIGRIPLVNAVQIVMVSKMSTESKAKEAIRAEVRTHEERFCPLKKQYQATSNSSGSILSLLNLLEDTMAGNFAWSLRVPRYWKIDRNPYHDHLGAFGSDEVRVIKTLAQVHDDALIDDTVMVDLVDPEGVKMSNAYRYHLVLADLLTRPAILCNAKRDIVIELEEKILMKCSPSTSLKEEVSLSPLK